MSNDIEGLYKSFTVGDLEDMLRKYPKGTEIIVACEDCNLSSQGGKSLIQIEDRTDKTFGFIQLDINNGGKV